MRAVRARCSPRTTSAALSAAAAFGGLALLLVGCQGRSNGELVGDLTGVTAPPTTAPAGPLEPNATVEFVIDGDTIDVIVDGEQERVRLIGIDTPETAHDAQGTRPASTAECFGQESNDYLALLLPVGTPVRLERDVVPRDDFGRLLAYVFRASDGVFVNYELARQGYAQPLSIPPNTTHRSLIAGAAADAEAADAGLWSRCG